MNYCRCHGQIPLNSYTADGKSQHSLLIMNFSKQRLNIIYGSQTGTAYDISTWLANVFRARFDIVCCVDGNTFIDQELDPSNCLNIFIVSTAGNGDAPINFRKCWQSIFSSDSIFTGLDFSVFGLGDSKYTQFNYASRMLFGRLQFRNCRPVCQLGCGDDQHILGYSQEFMPWASLLWHALFLEDFPVDSPIIFPPLSPVIKPSPLEYTKVMSHSLMTSSDHFQKVHRIEVDILGKWKYEPGDVLVVLPKVDSTIVDKFVFCYDSNQKYFGMSMYEIFTSVLDITSVPTHFFYQVLRQCFVNTSTEECEVIQSKLDQLAAFSPEGANERNRYSGKERLAIWEVLNDFHQLHVPVDKLFHIVPRIAPRYYSLAGCSQIKCVPYTKTRVTLCVAEYEWTTLFGRKRLGLASKYLSFLSVGECMQDRMWLERGLSSRLNEKISLAKSIILIGPGTGIAPIRAIIKSGICKPECKIMILTGYRNPKNDFLFAQEFPMIVAWSRPEKMDRLLDYCYTEDQNRCEATIGRKTWVQDLIPIFAKRVLPLLEDSTCLLFICGRSHPMPSQVLDELVKLAGTIRIDEMKKMGNIIFDTWA